MSDILTTGELLIDFSPVRIEGYPDMLCPNPGGAPANVAVQASRLGLSAGFIGKIGKDDFGEKLKDCLEENGVSTHGLIVDPKWKTTLAFVQLNKHGDRSFTFYRNPGADTQLTPDEIDLDDVKNCKILHFGSLSLTTEPGKSTTLGLIKKAREMGKLISYDPNWRPVLWESEEVGVAGMKLGLPLCDLIKISEEELALLTGCESMTEGVKAIHEAGAALAIVTLGPDGCAFSNGHGIIHQPTYDTKVVDTTGSGDSFWGAFLSCLVKGGYTTREALKELSAETLISFVQFANGAGSVCASHPGGIPALADEAKIRRCMETCPLLVTDFELN